MADERGRLLLGLGDRHQLDPVLGGEIVELVVGPARLDQVREDHRVVDDLGSQRLRVVGDQLALEPLGPRRDDDLVAGGRGNASIVTRDCNGTVTK